MNVPEIGEVAKMNTAEAQREFRKAVELYRQKQFQESLAVLELVETAFPSNKHLTWQKVLCLAAMSRFDEAVQACALIRAQFADNRVSKLKDWIEQNAGFSSASGTQPLPLREIPSSDKISTDNSRHAADARPAEAPACDNLHGHDTPTADAEKQKKMRQYAWILYGIGFLAFMVPSTLNHHEPEGSPLLPFVMILQIIIQPICVGLYAKSKGYSPAWGIIAVFLFIFSILLLVIFKFLPDKQEQPQIAQAKRQDIRKPRPYCGEMIMTDAIKCRYCGEFLEEIPAPRDSVDGRYFLQKADGQGILKIARAQKTVLWILLCKLMIIIALGVLVVTNPDLRSLFLLVAIVEFCQVISVCHLAFVIDSILAGILYVLHALVIVAVGFPGCFPVVFFGLILLLYVSDKATKILRKNGIKVGLMGAKM